MSREEQQKELDSAHQELFNLRFQLATRQLQNYGRIGVKVWIYRGDIAPEPVRRPELAGAAAPAGQGG